MWDVVVNFHVVLTTSNGGYGITRLSYPSVKRLGRNVLVAASFGQTACYKDAVIGHTIQGTPYNYVLRFIPMLCPPGNTHTCSIRRFWRKEGGSRHGDQVPPDVIPDVVIRRTYPPHILAL